MRILLAQLAPIPAEVRSNLRTIAAIVRRESCELAVFPELFASGYRIGDRFSQVALDPADPRLDAIRSVARERNVGVVFGAPIRISDRRGELANASVLVDPEGKVASQTKRYLPNYGPFEEAHFFTPTDRSEPVPIGVHRVGLEICYDTFFPEVSRELALRGADLLVSISASPVTSRSLFEKLLPARAVENATPVVYVNRVGVEDGIVFGGGSGAWDARGEPVALESVPSRSSVPEERIFFAEIDPAEAPRWRPFRPVLRDVATRPAGGGTRSSEPAPDRSTRPRRRSGHPERLSVRADRL